MRAASEAIDVMFVEREFVCNGGALPMQAWCSKPNCSRVNDRVLLCVLLDIDGLRVLHVK